MSTPPFGIASSLVNSCIAHLSKAPEAKRKKSDYQDRLDREFGRFRLWAEEFHDFIASSTNDQDTIMDPLDEALENSKYLKEPTIFLLSSFASCLLMKHFKTIGDDSTRASVESALQDAVAVYSSIPDSILGSDCGENSAVEEFHHIISALFELASPLYDVLESLRAPVKPNPLPITVVYRNFIRDKFPYAMAHLVLRFAEGNIECSKKLRAQAEEQGIVNQVPIQEQHPIVPIPALGDTGPVTTTAPEAVSHAPPSSFHDSGLGSSRPSEPPSIPNYIPQEFRSGATGPSTMFLAPPSVSALSESTMCSVSSTLELRSPIPAMPKNSGSRMGFDCSICHIRQKPMFKTRQWRKHIFSDLQPYMCISENCPLIETCFKSRKEWIAHHNSHNIQSPTIAGSTLDTETCPFCSKEFHSQKGRFYSHVGHHMEDIRLFALPLSYRDSDELDAFENSSKTSDSQALELRSRKDLSIIAEDVSSGTSTADAFSKQLQAYNIADEKAFLRNWLSAEEATEGWSDSVIESEGFKAEHNEEPAAESVSNIVDLTNTEPEFIAYREKILLWLSTINSLDHYQQAKEGLLDGTGQWLLNRKELREWQSSSVSGLFWLCGIIGSGKTKLTCVVQEALTLGPVRSGPILFFYCSLSDPHHHSANILIRTLLKQLAIWKPRLPELLVAVYQEYQNGGSVIQDLGTDKTLELLVSILNMHTQTTIIVDALDEIESYQCWQLLDSLNKILYSTTTVVKIFVSSRNDIDVMEQLEAIQPKFCVEITEKDISGDIERFVIRGVEDSIMQKRLLDGIVSDTLGQHIISTIIAGTKGMFVWASLQIQQLCYSQDEQDIYRSLGKLPQVLKEIYSQLWSNTSESEYIGISREIALKWLTCQQEPLNRATWVSVFEVPDGSNILLRCFNILISWDKHLDSVTFIHPSVREYFSEVHSSLDANFFVAKKCLSLYRETTHWRWRSQVDHWISLKSKNETTFVVYSIIHWAAHVQQSYNSETAISPNMLAILQTFFGTSSKPGQGYRKWLQAAAVLVDHPQLLRYGAEFQLAYDHLLLNPPDPSFAVAFFHFGGELIKYWKDEIPDINQLNGCGESLLYVASMQGNVDFMDFLLERGANIHARDQNDISPLMVAVKNGRRAAAMKLIRYGADLSPGSDYVQVPELVLGTRGINLVDEILARDGKTEFTEIVMEVAAASINGGKAAMEELIIRNPNTRISENVIEAAVKNPEDCAEIMRLLLNITPRVNITEVVIQRLMENGANAGIMNLLVNRYIELTGDRSIESLLGLKDHTPEELDTEDLSTKPLDSPPLYTFEQFNNITPEECLRYFEVYIRCEAYALNIFYPGDSLVEHARNATLMVQKLRSMGCGKEASLDLSTMCLYDIVMLIDDSSSMGDEEGRGGIVEAMMKEVTSIYDLARQTGLLSVKFVNSSKGYKNINRSHISYIMKNRVFWGSTPVGYALQKVLEEFVYKPEMERPLLIIIITDGRSEARSRVDLGAVIEKCKRELSNNSRRGKDAVAFTFLHVGSDEGAATLFTELRTTYNGVSLLRAEYVFRGCQHETLKWTVIPRLLLGGTIDPWINSNDQEHDVRSEYEDYEEDEEDE